MENLQRKNHNLKVKARADLRKQSKGYRNVYKNTEVEAFKLFRESKSALEKLEAKEEAVVEIFDALCAMTFYRGDLEDERNESYQIMQDNRRIHVSVAFVSENRPSTRSFRHQNSLEST